jgi:hypothetical protein
MRISPRRSARRTIFDRSDMSRLLSASVGVRGAWPWHEDLRCRCGLALPCECNAIEEEQDR